MQPFLNKQCRQLIDAFNSLRYMIRWGDGKNSNKQEGECFKDFSVSHTYPKGKHELTVTYQVLAYGRQWCGELKHHKVSC